MAFVRRYAVKSPISFVSRHLSGIFAILGLFAFAMAAMPANAQTRKIVAFGDSLSAGYQLGQNDAFPNVLEAALKKRGLDVSIENASVSGDTASGGLERLDWGVPEDTDLVILELGANDALRGINPTITEQALDDIITKLKQRNIAVLLAGMLAPRNNGPDYVAAFDGIYPRLAARHGIPLYPFFLDGVQGRPELNLADGIHPNPAGVRVIVDRILPTVEQALASLPKP
jgi:acyl-CoA thioesterase-1